MDDVTFSVVPQNAEYIYSLSDYYMQLRYNSGESFINIGDTYQSITFQDFTLQDYTGASTTVKNHIGYQYGDGTNSLVGTAGNNVLVNAAIAYGKGGNDIIWSCPTAYGYDIGQKNTTAGNSVKIYGAYDIKNTMYAQSETNELYGHFNDDTYYAYIDQKTSIWEGKGELSGVKTGDVLNLVNTSDSDKDGQLFDNSDNRQLHVRFDVTRTYDREASGAKFAFGDVTFVDNDNLAQWRIQEDYNGITISNNAVETINTTDSYYITNTDIADLAASVAGWLSDNGYDSVNGVLTNALEKSAAASATDISALIAKFDTANWQHV